MNYCTERVAVITGAGSGIGRALAVNLARHGAQLALSDRDADAVAATASQCQHVGARVRSDLLDVTDRQAVLNYAAAVAGAFGRVNLVFCAAGIIHTGSLLATDLADFDQVMQVNLFGVVNTAKAFLPHLIASGDGLLVTFSSGFGLMAAPHYSAYNASKFAVRGFSEAIRQEMVIDGHPVSVTCVYPGGVRTPIMRNGLFAADENVASVTAMFDTKIARMDPERAAVVILRGVERKQPQVLVGVDARVLSAFVRLVGSGYQQLVPWAARKLGDRR